LLARKGARGKESLGSGHLFGYRLWGPVPSFQRSPLTLGIFFLMASYYVAYYAGVLRKARTMGAAEPTP
jgi:hypothetical protein